MITDDAMLVKMVLDGKREAFDELVRKHRSRVLSAARSLVGTADGAEDVAQQAFVAAFANLRLLRDPASFRPWLMTITRRCATRQWTAQSHEANGLQEAVIASPYYQPVGDSEVRAGIAEILAELSAFDRKIVVMHYLDGCSCREIGETLGVPAGTVKRILHESRSSLRASSELTRGVEEMSQKHQGPRRMKWSISGAEWPHGVMDSVLRQSICLTINKRGLTPEQIAKRVDANEVYVREALDALEAEELVEKVGRGRYRNTFIAVGAGDWVQLSREIRPTAERVAHLLAEALPELQAAWDSSPKPEQGFDWSTGAWLMTAILVCHYGRVRNGPATQHLDPPIPLHPASGKRYLPAGREFVGPEHVLWTFVWNLAWGQEFSYGFLWTKGLGFGRRPWSDARESTMPEERRRLFEALAKDRRDIESAAKAADMDLEKAREAAASAVELGFLDRTEDGLVLSFPVFSGDDDVALLPAVDKVSKRLAGELSSVPSLVEQRLREFGFGPWEKQFWLWHSTPQYDAAAEGVRILYNRRLLPDPGDPAPANFCMWGWFGHKGLFTCEK